MKAENVFGLILAGGTGTRLWPRSTKQLPKQCLPLTEEKKTLIQLTFERVAKKIPQEAIWVSANELFQNELQKQLSKTIGKDFSRFFVEPIGKNTAPAILWTSLYFYEINPNAILCLFPSDHHIPVEEDFVDLLTKGIEEAEEGNLVTFGIAPSAPKTGYGYIEKDKRKTRHGYYIKKFVEKPDVKTAQNYYESGEYFWNSGMFVFPVKTLLDEFKKYQPKMVEVFQELINAKEDILHSPRLKNCFEKIESISIDYAILEKSKKTVVIPGNLKWSDLGDWASVMESLQEEGKLTQINKKEVYTISSSNNLVWNETKPVAIVGVNDLVIVETEKVMLVCSLEQSQEVKKLVELLKKEGVDNLL